MALSELPKASAFELNKVFFTWLFRSVSVVQNKPLHGALTKLALPTRRMAKMMYSKFTFCNILCSLFIIMHTYTHYHAQLLRAIMTLSYHIVQALIKKENEV